MRELIYGIIIGISLLCFFAFSIYLTIVAVQILWPFALFTACVSITYAVYVHLSDKDK